MGVWEDQVTQFCGTRKEVYLREILSETKSDHSPDELDRVIDFAVNVLGYHHMEHWVGKELETVFVRQDFPPTPKVKIGSKELKIAQPGYHLTPITRGVYGEPSKIREELEELEDALRQKNRIMALVELADLYGALEGVVERQGATMDEIRTMAATTRRVFENGHRKSK